MIFHITYTDRRTRQTETGRVSVPKSPSGAARTRRDAIVTARSQYPYAVASSISAVACPGAPGSR